MRHALCGYVERFPVLGVEHVHTIGGDFYERETTTMHPMIFVAPLQPYNASTNRFSLALEEGGYLYTTLADTLVLARKPNSIPAQRTAAGIQDVLRWNVSVVPEPLESFEDIIHLVRYASDSMRTASVPDIFGYWQRDKRSLAQRIELSQANGSLYALESALREFQVIFGRSIRPVHERIDTDRAASAALVALSPLR